MRGVSCGEDLVAPRGDVSGVAVVNGRRREQPDSRVPMLGVVPGEERLAEGPRRLDGGEPIRKLGPVLERLELRWS
jgi:hypothetical protein